MTVTAQEMATPNRTPAREMIVARRAANGAADNTFATSGTLMANAGTGASRANAIALGNGVIYVVGWASNGTNDDAVLLGIH